MNNGIEIKYPNYCVIMTLKNDDILMFSLYCSERYGACLMVEDIPYNEFNTPDEIISGVGEEEILKELTILEDGINTVDVNGKMANLPILVKEINIYDNEKYSKLRIAGNLVKYDRLVADKYELDEKYAYDYIKPNIRERKIK